MVDLKYLEYLRKLDKIVIPNEFTYFVHNTLFGRKEKEFDKMWEEIPTDSFTVKREMSFVDRDARVMEALDYGGLKKASNSYGVNPRGKNFQIRVIMPQKSLTPEQLKALQISPEEKKVLEMEYRGLGDNRHPKLKNGEKIYIFASTTKDEISNKEIDILYGIREQDIERYARIVQRLLQLEQVQPFELSDRTINGVSNREVAKFDYEKAIKAPYMLKRDPDLSRYTRTHIVDANGNVQLIGFSQFEKEFIQEKGIYPRIIENEKSQQQSNTHKVPSFEEKLKVQFGDIIEPTQILQVQDGDLLRKLRTQNGIDPLQPKIEFYFVDSVDKEDEDYNGVGIYMRDRSTGYIRQVKLPIAEEVTSDKIVDLSRSARMKNGNLIAARSDRLATWKLFDGSNITVFRDNNGDIHVGNNDATNNRLVNVIKTKLILNSRSKVGERTSTFQEIGKATIDDFKMNPEKADHVFSVLEHDVKDKEITKE